MPLCIPPMWGVISSKWFDVDAVLEEGKIVNSDAFDEDLLVMYQFGDNVGAEKIFAVLPSGLVVDMAWRPIWSVEGSYILNILRGSWDDPVYTYTTRNRDAMRSVIDQCLAAIAKGVPDADIPAHIHPPLPDGDNAVAERSRPHAPSLMPLRLLYSWGVVKNQFRDEDPVVENGRIVNSDGFGDDVLVLCRIGYKPETRHAAIPGGHVVALAWSPPGDPGGAYHLSVTRGKGGREVLHVSLRDRYAMRAAIERCLLLIIEGVPDAEIPSRVGSTPVASG